MGRVEFRRPRPPACACAAARRDEPEGTRSLPCLPCPVAAAAAVWNGVAKALRARPPLSQRSSPPAASAAAQGGRARSMSATDLVAFGWGRLRPQCGDRRRGAARLWRAAEMRRKALGSDAGGGGGGGAARLGRGGRGSPAARVAPL